jgi:hypothetical protein
MSTQISLSQQVLEALCHAKLYINPKKTKLLVQKVDFLGYHISEHGIKTDNSKVEKILSWPIPKLVTQAHSFIGLVWYLAAFLPNLASHTTVLSTLTTKAAEKSFPTWSNEHQHMFNSIKKIVVGQDCLTTIDFTEMPEKKIYITTDASNTCSSTLLSFGTTWESAPPVAFNSTTFKGTESNYLIHKKELLVIMHALRKW